KTGEAVRDERAGQRGSDRADDRDGERVEEQARVVELVPDVAEVLPVRVELPRGLQCPPRALPRDERCIRTGCRIGELAGGSALSDQGKVTRRARDRDLVDVVVAVLVREPGWTRRVERGPDLGHLLGTLQRQRDRQQERG